MNREAMIAGLREEIERLNQVLELFEQGGEATESALTSDTSEETASNPW